MTDKLRFCVTMDDDVVKKIDVDRGLIPRSTYLNAKMKEIVMPESRPKHADITAAT